MVILVEMVILVVIVDIIMVEMIIIVVMFIMVGMVIMIGMDIMVVLVVTTFKLDFPGNLCSAPFAILAMFLTSGEGRTRGKTIN